MTWKSFHHRGDVLRTVIATANTRRDARLPLDVDGVETTFDSALDLLGTLQLRWHTRLAGHIERQLMTQPLDLPLAVAVAWGDTCDELPGVRLLLDHYRAHPLDDEMAAVMTRASVKERSMLATMAGLAGVEDLSAAPVGAQIEERARALHRGVSVLNEHEERPTFLERLRSVLAA